MLVFGSTKYKELEELHKRLKKAKTASDILRLQKQIEFLKNDIKKEEEDAEDYFAKN